MLLSLPYDSQYASAPVYLEASGVPIANGNVIIKNKVFGVRTYYIHKLFLCTQLFFVYAAACAPLAQGAATVQVNERLIALTSVCKDTTCGAESTMIISASISYAGPLPGRNPDENEAEFEH